MTDAFNSRLINQTDTVDEKSCDIGEQFALSHKLKDDVSHKFATISSWFKTDEEYDYRMKLWPYELGQLIQKTKKKADTFKESALELMDSLILINAKVVQIWYETVIPAESKKIINDRINFPMVSGTPVHEALSNGDEAFISRVLETNIGWLVDGLGKDIEAALSNGKEPKLTVILSSPSMLSKIAESEVKYAKERKKLFECQRGVSSSEIITGVRHLALWSGTMRALSILKQRFPSNVKICLKNGNPSERGNIAKVDGKPYKVFCVGIPEWELGLDSNFYEIKDPFQKRLFERDSIKKLTPDRVPDKIETALEVAMKAEQNLLNQKINGQILGDVISNKMKKTEKSNFHKCWKSISKGEEGFVPSFMDLPLESDSLSAIKEAQMNIENIILPAIRADLGV